MTAIIKGISEIGAPLFMRLFCLSDDDNGDNGDNGDDVDDDNEHPNIPE